MKFYNDNTTFNGDIIKKSFMIGNNILVYFALEAGMEKVKVYLP